VLVDRRRDDVRGEPGGSAVRVLIVDDESSVRFLLRRVFERAGYEVVEAHHGAAALARVADANPDLVVTDMMMPVMGGAELIAHLRADPETASIPIVVVSAELAFASHVADAVLTKPFRADELLDAVRSLTAAGG
jgi:CheY-like chemotaxis protein